MPAGLACDRPGRRVGGGAPVRPLLGGLRLPATCGDAGPYSGERKIHGKDGAGAWILSLDFIRPLQRHRWRISVWGHSR